MADSPKVAILDLNNNHPNQGLRCIREIVENYPEPMDWQIFDVRYKKEISDKGIRAYEEKVYMQREGWLLKTAKEMGYQLAANELV